MCKQNLTCSAVTSRCVCPKDESGARGYQFFIHRHGTGFCFPIAAVLQAADAHCCELRNVSTFLKPKTAFDATDSDLQPQMYVESSDCRAQHKIPYLKCNPDTFQCEYNSGTSPDRKIKPVNGTCVYGMEFGGTCPEIWNAKRPTAYGHVCGCDPGTRLDWDIDKKKRVPIAGSCSTDDDCIRGMFHPHGALCPGLPPHLPVSRSLHRRAAGRERCECTRG